MKKCLTALALCLAAALCLAGCAVEDTADPALLEFPGTHWNDTPEQVIYNLHLKPEQLLCNEEQPMSDTEQQWVILAKDVTCFGQNARTVCFLFIHYDGYPGTYGLNEVRVCYPEEADMGAVQTSLEDRYGVAADTPPESHLIRNGQVVAAPSGTSQPGRYWSAYPEGRITETMRENAFRTSVANGAGYSREALDEYLDADPLVTLTLAEDTDTWWNRNSDYYTGDFLRFNAGNWIFLLKKFA